MAETNKQKSGENPINNGRKTDEYQEKPGGKFKEGNPGGGRPSGSKNFGTIFDEAIKKIVEEKKIDITDPEREMVTKAIVEALKGNFAYYRDTMDRKYGRPKETHEIGGIEGKPIPILYELYNNNSNSKDSPTKEAS